MNLNTVWRDYMERILYFMSDHHNGVVSDAEL